MSFYNLDFDGSKYKDVLLFFRTQLCGCLNNTYIYMQDIVKRCRLKKIRMNHFEKMYILGPPKMGKNPAIVTA